MAGALLRTLYVEQQVAVYRERPGLGGSQRLQLVGGLRASAMSGISTSWQ